MMSTTIAQALAARDTARIEHEKAVAALDRARQAVAEATADTDRYAAEESQWIARHTRKVGDWIASGSHGPRPAAVADASALQRQLSAKANAQAAASALTNFESAEREARQALTDAEAAVDRSVRAQLAAEGDALARQILDRDAETEAMRRQLQGLRELVLPTALHRRAAPMAGDWQFIPMPELREAEALAQQHLEASPADVAHWQRRRAELLKAASPESASAAA